MDFNKFNFKSIFSASLISLSSVSFGFESRFISIDNDWTPIDTSTYEDPVIIAGVSTRNEADPGVVSVIKDASNTFQVRYREWDYLDGIHSSEDLAFLIVEKGNFQLADDTVIEAGTFSLSSGAKHISFNQSFEHAPLVFLSPQSENDPATYSLRVEGITRLGFDTRLEEQELNNVSGHADEEIAYFAIYAPQNSGVFSLGNTFFTTQVLATHDPVDVVGYGIFVEEEQSRDAEITHINEAVSVLLTDHGIIAQTTSIYGGNTQALALSSIPQLTGTSCRDVLVSNPDAPSAFYTLDVDGIGPLPSFSTYCDMEFDGGGWTLVAAVRDNERFEANNIIDFVNDQYLPDSIWQAIKSDSSELYADAFTNDNWVIAPFENILSGVCVPLTDTLSADRIFQVEENGCDTASQDYSMIGQSNLYNGRVGMWNHYPEVYSATSGFTKSAGTTGLDLYVR